jgi:hypothetical protein
LLRRRRSLDSLLAVCLCCACQSRPAAHESAQGDQPSPPADSLALTTATGTSVWFTLARSATGPDGRKCVERGIEIRSPGKHIAVPLLYTAEPPELLNDSTLRARLWTNCAPGDLYRVDLRTGRPIREGGKGAP